MNHFKIYISLLGLFLFQIIFLGFVNLLFKDSFFSKNDLKSATIMTIVVGVFVVLQHRKSKTK